MSTSATTIPTSDLPADHPVLKPVRDLYTDTAGVTSLPYDFGQGYGEDAGWNVVLPDPSEWDFETCRRFLVHHDVDLPAGVDPVESDRDALLGFVGMEERDLPLDLRTDLNLLREHVRELIEYGDEINEWRDACQEWIDENDSDYHPTMNYLWPLADYSGDGQADQLVLDLWGGPIVLVEVAGNSYLAMSGGGMDLSWHIARAYMLLGHLPPADVVQNGLTGGREFDSQVLTRWVLEGCRRSLDCVIFRADRGLARIASTARKALGDAAGDLGVHVELTDAAAEIRKLHMPGKLLSDWSGIIRRE
jgi:hypothetical protein